MATKEYRIKVKQGDVKVRDEAMKALITRNGGAVRVFSDRKRQSKADRTGRKAKYKALDKF